MSAAIVIGSFLAIGLSVLVYKAKGWQFEEETDDNMNRRMVEYCETYDYRNDTFK